MNNQAILKILKAVCDEAEDCLRQVLVLMHSQGTANDSRGRATSETSKESVECMLRAIDDINELLFRQESTRTVQEFEARRCVSQTVELLNLAAPEPTDRIILEPPIESHSIRQDRQAVEQVLMRVLDAILKLGPTGSVHVFMRKAPEGDGILLTIVPSGDLAMQLFYWLNVDAEQFIFQDGDSIPIAVEVMIAARQLRALGGTWEAARSGESATLVIHFPSLPVEAGDESPVQDSSPTTQDALNILIAEDCDDSYAIGQLVLRDENLCRARSGSEAVDLMKRRPFDIIFMDVHMPGIDGYAAVRAIRDWETQTARARTPIVILSSDDLETQRQCAAQSGCSGFLRKPLRYTDLAGLLSTARAARTAFC